MLLQHPHIRHHHPAINRPAHVLDRQQPDLHGVRRFDLTKRYNCAVFKDNERQSKNICTKVLDFLITDYIVKDTGVSGASWQVQAGGALPSRGGIFFQSTIEVDMKTLLIAFACVSVLAACKNEVPAPVTTAPAVVVPADTTTATTAATSETAPATATTPASVSGSSGSSVAGASEGSGDGIYVVGKGDTLWDIAEKNGISHGDLAKWNNVNDPRELQVGRKLSLTAP